MVNWSMLAEANGKTALSATPLEKNTDPTRLLIPAPPAGQKIIANDSVSCIGSKSVINIYFQKTGTGSDDFQKFKRLLKIAQNRQQSYNFVPVRRGKLNFEALYFSGGLRPRRPPAASLANPFSLR
jgi:hypothetical protein